MVISYKLWVMSYGLGGSRKTEVELTPYFTSNKWPDHLC